MATSSNSLRGNRSLRVEPLENRHLLSAAPTGWTPDFICDVDGDLFTVDTSADGAVEYVGRMEQPMHDVAFSPEGELFGIGPASRNELFRIDLDADLADDVLPTLSVGTIASETDPLPEVTSLTFRKDGTLMATGKPADEVAQMVWIDPETLAATDVRELSLHAPPIFGPLFPVIPPVFGNGADGLNVTSIVPSVVVPYVPPLLVDTVRDFVVSPLGNPDGSGQAMYISDAVAGRLITVSEARPTYFYGDLGGLDIGEFEGLTHATDADRLHGYREDGEVLSISTDGDRIEFISQLQHDRLDAIAGATNAQRYLNDLGSVASLYLPDQRSPDGELWYRVDVQPRRLFTVEKASSDAEGCRIALCRYDDEGNLEELAADPLRIDYEVPEGRREYVVHVTEIGSGVDLRMGNLVAAEDGSDSERLVEVFGTSSAADRVEFTPGAPHVLDVNGLLYRFEADRPINVETRGGIEHMVLNGDQGDDEFLVTGPVYVPPQALALRPLEASLRGDWGRVDVRDANAVITVNGYGGHDTATFGGFSDASKYLKASPEEARVSYMLPIYVPTLATDAITSGDAVITEVEMAVEIDPIMWMPRNYFNHTAAGFEEVTAVNIRNANLSDSPGDDRLHCTPSSVELSGEGYSISAMLKGAITVEAHSAGGNDVAELHGSDGDDLFVATPTYARLSGYGSEVRVRDFNNVEAHAGPDGLDVARLYDSAGNDLFVTSRRYGALSGEGYKITARGFHAMHAYATAGGIDVAKHYDSPGDDTFYADPEHGALFGDDYYNRAKFFEGVHAYATAGGQDTARLFGSGGDDIFRGTPEHSALYGPGFYNRAKHFEMVFAEAGGDGHDKAYLADSPSKDFFLGEFNFAQLTSRSPIGSWRFAYQVTDFDFVQATSTEGDDEALVDIMYAVEYDLDLQGPWRPSPYIYG